jgi:hypothetical protein
VSPRPPGSIFYRFPSGRQEFHPLPKTLHFVDRPPHCTHSQRFLNDFSIPFFLAGPSHTAPQADKEMFYILRPPHFEDSRTRPSGNGYLILSLNQVGLSVATSRISFTCCMFVSDYLRSYTPRTIGNASWSKLFTAPDPVIHVQPCATASAVNANLGFSR